MGIWVPELPGLRLADPDTANWQGQIIYLDFDGEKNIVYNGPVTVGPFDVPAFQAPAGLESQEGTIISVVSSELQSIFVGTGIIFTTQRPSQGTEYSTIYIGGDDSAFASYGSFIGLAEQGDVGNSNLSDEALVFSDRIAQQGRGEHFAARLAGTIAHEVGHLLGFAHIYGTESAPPILSVAAVLWDGGGDGTSWHDRFNWAGDVLPGTTDDAVINLAESDPVIAYSAASGTRTVRSITSDEAFVLSGGSLTVSGGASEFRAAFSLTGGSPTATGTGTSLSAAGPTSLPM